MALLLSMQNWCGPYQVGPNDDSGLTLTYYTTRLNVIPNLFIWGKSSLHFSITVKIETLIFARNV